MKKYLASILALLLLCGCAAKPAEEAESKLRVITTVFPPYDFVRQIAGDKVNLSMLLPPGCESHGYEPTLADLAAIQKSDLLFYAGDDSDDWVNTLPLSENDTGKMLALNDMVSPTEKAHAGHTHEEEHLWTSVRNAMQMVQRISAALCKADAANAVFYTQNTQKYLLALKQLDADFSAAVSAAPLKTLVFAEQFPFACFAEDYGLQWYAAFDHCASDFEPKIDVIHDLIGIVRAQKIPVVFTIEFSDRAVADIICEATGCETVLFHSCHNVTEQEFAKKATYLSLMRDNLAVLRKALNYDSDM